MADRPPEACRALSAPRRGRANCGASPSPSSPRRRTTRRSSAIKAQEEAGLDIITDGEIRRESYSNRFATALEGVDIDNPGYVAQPLRTSQSGAAHRRQDPPHAAGRGRGREIPATPHDEAAVKMTVPGPFTMSQQAQNDYLRRHRRGRRWTMPMRSMPRSRICSRPAPTSCRSTSPICRRGPTSRARYGLAALNRALEGVAGTTIVHLCFGYAAIVHERPSAYSFLPQLKGCRCRQISIETAQSQSRLLGAEGTTRAKDPGRRARSLLDEVETRRDGRGAHPQGARLPRAARTSSSRPTAA